MMLHSDALHSTALFRHITTSLVLRAADALDDVALVSNKPGGRWFQGAMVSATEAPTLCTEWGTRRSDLGSTFDK